MPNEEMNPEELQGAVPAGQAPKGPLTPGGEDTPKKPEDKPKDTDAEAELLDSIMYSPTSADADPMLSIDKTTDDNDRDIKDKPTAKELLKVLESGSGQMAEKYQKELLDKALKDPTSVAIETPKGWMSVADAIGEGFDLTTGDFTDEPIPKVDWEGEISKLDPREQETIRNLTQPGRRQAGPSKKEAPQDQGGDVIPGPTGEPIPGQEQLSPEDASGALGGNGAMEGTNLPLGGV